MKLWWVLCLFISSFSFLPSIFSQAWSESEKAVVREKIEDYLTAPYSQKGIDEIKDNMSEKRKRDLSFLTNKLTVKYGHHVTHKVWKISWDFLERKDHHYRCGGLVSLQNKVYALGGIVTFLGARVDTWQSFWHIGLLANRFGVNGLLGIGIEKFLSSNFSLLLGISQEWRWWVWSSQEPKRIKRDLRPEGGVGLSF